MTGCEADCHWLKLQIWWFRSTVRVGERTQSSTQSFNHQKNFSLSFLFILIPFLVFYHFMKQQSLPTCMNHTGGSLSVLAAQIAHLLQFTDVLVEAVAAIWSDSLSALHWLEGVTTRLPAAPPPVPTTSTPNCCTLHKPAVIDGLGSIRKKRILKLLCMTMMFVICKSYFSLFCSILTWTLHDIWASCLTQHESQNTNLKTKHPLLCHWDSMSQTLQDIFHTSARPLCSHPAHQDVSLPPVLLPISNRIIHSSPVAMKTKQKAGDR